MNYFPHIIVIFILFFISKSNETNIVVEIQCSFFLIRFICSFSSLLGLLLLFFCFGLVSLCLCLYYYFGVSRCGMASSSAFDTLWHCTQHLLRVYVRAFHCFVVFFIEVSWSHDFVVYCRLYIHLVPPLLISVCVSDSDRVSYISLVHKQRCQRKKS